MMSATTKQQWQSMVASSKAKGEHNDCTVKALTAATGLSYDQCHAALAKHGRKHRKGCHFASVGKKAAADLGFLMETLPWDSYRAKTCITAERDRALRNGRYVLQVRRHVAAMIDGEVCDWSQGRRHRLQAVYSFTPIPGHVAPEAPMRDPLPTGSATWQSFRKYTKKDNFELF